MQPIHPSQDFFYFEHGGRRLFGVYFRPQGQRKNPGFVLCSGFGKDAVVFRTQLSYFARELARRGYPAMRFDYTGYGDSEGEFADASPREMCGEIEAALDELQRRSDCTSFGLIGLRLGGTLAALVAAKRAEITRLVLWAPLVQLWKSLFEELRMTITMQTLHFKEVRLTREKIVENILAGQPSVIDGLDFNVIHDGFPLGTQFVREAKDIDLLGDPPRFNASSLIVHITEHSRKPIPKDLVQFTNTLKERGTPCTLEIGEVPMLPWVDGRHWMAHSPEVFAKTLAWLEA